ncbi:hypothetical protein AS026_13440 [Rhizobium altiplani]|uniref:Uncharacterized protein n=1 Tax=Rhizobium altiplani TaxID=1864509 RepID=A0A120FIN4_9HYPH|nr:hypothetical protein AS026_13440 [Rhizobium altiplani]
MWFCSASCALQQFRLHASEEVVAQVPSQVIGRQGPAPNIMKAVMVLRERKIAEGLTGMTPDSLRTDAGDHNEG